VFVFAFGLGLDSVCIYAVIRLGGVRYCLHLLLGAVSNCLQSVLHCISNSNHYYFIYCLLLSTIIHALCLVVHAISIDCS